MTKKEKKKHAFSLVLASDHAGIVLKQKVYEYLGARGFVVLDMGPFTTDRVDYPDFIIPACEVIAQSDGKIRGIMICCTGIGACISANKVKGIRASLCFDAWSARLTRSHNDSNVLCLGQGAAAGKNGAWQRILGAWLKTKFSGDLRHLRRLRKIALYEGRK